MFYFCAFVCIFVAILYFRGCSRFGFECTGQLPIPHHIGQLLVVLFNIRGIDGGPFPETRLGIFLEADCVVPDLAVALVRDE